MTSEAAVRYRVGRHLGRSIYLIDGEQDTFIGIMDRVEDARMVVDALNAAGGIQPWVIHVPGVNEAGEKVADAVAGYVDDRALTRWYRVGDVVPAGWRPLYVGMARGQ